MKIGDWMRTRVWCLYDCWVWIYALWEISRRSRTTDDCSMSLVCVNILFCAWLWVTAFSPFWCRLWFVISARCNPPWYLIWFWARRGVIRPLIDLICIWRGVIRLDDSFSTPVIVFGPRFSDQYCFPSLTSSCAIILRLICMRWYFVNDWDLKFVRRQFRTFGFHVATIFWSFSCLKIRSEHFLSHD